MSIVGGGCGCFAGAGNYVRKLTPTDSGVFDSQNLGRTVCKIEFQWKIAVGTASRLSSDGKLLLEAVEVKFTGQPS